MSNLTDFVNTIGNGTNFNGTSPPVAGAVGTFGDPIILGAVGILLVLIICIVRKASLDLTIVSCLSMVIIASSTTISNAGANLLSDWIFWLFILGGGIIFGLGMIKVIKHR